MPLTPTIDMWQSQRVNISEVCVYSSWKISSCAACNWKYLRLENRIINCQIHPLPCCTMTKTFLKETFRNVKICYLFSENQDVRQKFIRKMATLWKMGDAEPQLSGKQAQYLYHSMKGGGVTSVWHTVS